MARLMKCLKATLGCSRLQYAKLGRLERLEVSSEAKVGKVVKLDKQQTRYAAEVTKGGQTMKIIVDARGKIVEEPKWDATKDAAKKSA